MTNDMDAVRPFQNVQYQPEDPVDTSIPIGLIGCGGITVEHLSAYRAAGYQVVAFSDIDISRAVARRDEFFPDAEVYDDPISLLRSDTVSVVDIATHTDVRPPLIESALQARKHVISQKPFVLDLDVGERLVELADRQEVVLSVNQNGRWAPHFSYARNAVDQGMLGELSSANLTVHWDHTWVQGTEFEKIRHLVLYDYAIHWFDIVSCFFQQVKAERVFASMQRSPTQTIMPPLVASANIEYESGIASLFFNADTSTGPQNRMYLTGSKATVSSCGPSDRHQTLEVHTSSESIRPNLQGSWFPDGFHGTMGETLKAIEEKRPPSIDAKRNLRSLELCFAAVASAEQGIPIKPGSVRKLPGT